MSIAVPHPNAIAKAGLTILCLSILLLQTLLPGCQWASTRSGGSDSLSSALAEDYEALAAENKRLKEQTKTLELDLVKLQAENDRHKQVNVIREEEFGQLRADLQRVEKQFIRIEERLQVKETKASAVAAVAEVQMLFDNMRADQTAPLDSSTTQEVTEQLNTSDQMMRVLNYDAAVYYAKRAMRTLNQQERRRNLALVDGDTRVIMVSKANMREGPGANFEVIEKLDYGAVIVQLGIDKDWCRVRTKSGSAGWVHASLLR